MGNRIVPRETLDQKVDRLAAEIVAMRLQLDDVTAALKSESKDTTKHIGSLYGRIRDITEYLIPIVDKTFPTLRKTQHELAAFMQRARRDARATKNGHSSSD